MSLTIDRSSAGPAKRRLPIQIANEERMITATIDLLGEHEVADITSRMIAERSGTATNYISRYFGGRDALLSAVVEELGWRIAHRMDEFGTRPELQDPTAYLVAVVALPEVGLWFQVSRYLSSRGVTRARTPGGRSPVVVATESAVARIFGIDSPEAAFWTNVVLTYLMGGLAFGNQLGTGHDEGVKVLARLGRAVEVIRDSGLSLDATA
jgi:AcrR family transcriptional regulator